MRHLIPMLLGGALLLGAACDRVEVAPDAASGTSAAVLPEADLALDLSLDERFHPVRREGRTSVLRLEGVPDVELWLVVGRDPVQGPAPTTEKILAKARAFLEPIHGELAVDETPQGNSLLRFEAAREEGNRTLHTVNWMLVRPSADAILRADVSLRVPGPWAGTPLVKGLSDHVAERLREARFRPES